MTNTDNGPQRDLFKSNRWSRARTSRLFIFIVLFVLTYTACSRKIDLKAMLVREPVPETPRVEDFFTRESKRLPPKTLPVIRPVQITFEADSVLYAAVSPDNQWLLYTSGQRELSGLWLRSANPSNVVLPKRLTSEAGTLSSPAFSPDGRWIIFSGTSYD
ncbi:hypothetical protein ACFLZG_02940, partial [Thermodesulfobacteriota bacterium]